ncbi:MAG: polysaccharide deacetylase family protein [Bacteroidia bacterium]
MALRYLCLYCCGLLLWSSCSPGQEPQTDKIAVLTFDDAVKSHRTFVAPFLKEMGFGATFFVTHKWMEDTVHFMNWKDIAEIKQMGFEIGNHTWTHDNFGKPENATRLAEELLQVEAELKKAGVPPSVSFAYTGNFFGPEAWQTLQEQGFQFARRGMQPEKPYGEIQPGPLYDPQVHHPLLIPTSGDAYPSWNLAHFKKVVDRAEKGKIVILQFHGVPDSAHLHVHTPLDSFKVYMNYLKTEGFKVIAMQDLAAYLPSTLPADTMLEHRYSGK